MKKTLLASTNPIEDIKAVTYAGQPEKRRMYRSGYEPYFNQLPVLDPGEVNVQDKFAQTQDVIQALANKLQNADWVKAQDVEPGDFTRTIIALEAPIYGSVFGDFENGSRYVQKEGKELIVAKWGDGFQSPVHGHASGLIIEELLEGMMLINLYQMTSPTSDVVRPLSVTLAKGRKTIASLYTPTDPDAYFKRQDLIHSFKSIGFSASLHYVPEHTRDGRDNGFKVEWFDVMYDVNETNSRRVTVEEAMNLKAGTVLLVRSKNVPEYGDHFITILSDHLVVKPHGLRQQEVAIPVSAPMPILDAHDDGDTVLLVLNEEMTKLFLDFHGIVIEQAKVKTFDDVYDLRFDQVTRLTTEEAQYARRTDVLLVRSKSLPEIGDHYVVVTGHAVQKDHGFRPQTAIFPALQNSPLLDMFDDANENVVLLKLNNEATQEFLNFYGIHLDEAYNVVSEKTELQLI